MSTRAATGLSVITCALLAACSGSSVLDTSGGATASDCDGSCASPTSFLHATDVQKILAQAIAEAQARGTPATIAVVDRVGNVLAVYRMGPASSRQVLIATRTDALGAPLVSGGLEGISLPTAAAPVSIDDQAAIAKALTAAYVSTEGNAFSTRTAGQIIQQHFNPGEANQPSGPLFGVQFSQLACSDFMASGAAAGTQPGPQRSPLGLSADPGGFPLYMDGTVVGGIGVMADGRYGIDADIGDTDADIDEAIALAGTFGYAAPVNRRADRITLDGRTARFSDVEFAKLLADPAAAPAFGSLGAGVGTLVNVTGYGGGTLIDGTAFGQPSSGLRADTEATFPGADAFVPVNNANLPRFPPIAGQALPGGAELSAIEVKALLQSALDIANRSRAQIRQPLGTRARLTISVVDHLGKVLGVASTRDPPVFGLDVSVQKARSAALFSSSDAAAFITSLPAARYLDTGAPVLGAASSVPGDYITSLRNFTGIATLLGDGNIAWSNRAIGLLARPNYPDGIDAAPAGPLSRPAGQWSVFADGLQLDVSLNSLLHHLLYVAGAVGTDVPPGCAGTQLAISGAGVPTFTHPVAAGTRLANGLQIFPGSVPIYRNGTLVGAIGVSGDGVDQDDMVAFLGLHDAAQLLGTGLGNAPNARRADALAPQSVRLRYVQCPQAPFISGSSEGVCDGK